MLYFLRKQTGLSRPPWHIKKKNAKIMTVHNGGKYPWLRENKHKNANAEGLKRIMTERVNDVRVKGIEGYHENVQTNYDSHVKSRVNGRAMCTYYYYCLDMLLHDLQFKWQSKFTMLVYRVRALIRICHKQKWQLIYYYSLFNTDGKIYMNWQLPRLHESIFHIIYFVKY